MNEATSVLETLPLEEADECQFVVLAEDPATHDSAMEVCREVSARFDVELSLAFSFWKFRDLSNPALAPRAAEAVARADIILFSLQGRDLAPETMNWLESCAQLRTKAEGALALIVTQFPGTNPALESLWYQMQYVAHQLRMDFLPLVPLPAGISVGTSADPSPALLSADQEEFGGNHWDHWGLNE
jgi:hypothetical protein